MKFPDIPFHTTYTAEPLIDGGGSISTDGRFDLPDHPARGAAPPEFIRLPRTGSPCPHTGLSRSALNELILGDSPPVRSVVIRKPGRTRGIRLIDYQSLINYLRSLMDAPSRKPTEMVDHQPLAIQPSSPTRWSDHEPEDLPF